MIAVVPARKGSKGLKNKCLKKFLGKPLIYYTLKAAVKSKKIKKVYLLTDCKKIANYSQKNFDIEIPFLRPKKISSDSSDIIHTYKYFYDFLKKKGTKLTRFCSLLPTAPLRTSGDIDRAINIFYKRKAKSVISVCKSKKPIEWHRVIKKNGSLDYFSKNFDNIKNRQKLESTFVPNGAIYIFNTNSLFKSNSYIFKNKSFPFVMPFNKSIDIDDIVDFKLAESLYE